MYMSLLTIPHNLDYYSYIISLKIENFFPISSDSSNFIFLFWNCFSYSNSSAFHYKFQSILAYIYKKNFGILIEIKLHLYIRGELTLLIFWVIQSMNMVCLSIHLNLWFIRSALHSFQHISCFIMFIHNISVLSLAVVNGIAFLILVFTIFTAMIIEIQVSLRFVSCITWPGWTHFIVLGAFS